MKRIRRDLNKRIGSSGYQQIAGDLEVRGRILGPSVSNLATGISKMSATTTTPVQLAAPTASGGYRSVVLDWERQYNLGNLSHYNLSVAQSPNGPWYVPCSDGGNWGFAEGSLPLQSEMFVHANIPPLGSADDPVGRTLYYRVQQETKSGQQSAWSEIASATTTTVQSGDLAANSIYANNIKAAEIVALLLRANNLWAGFAGVGTYENPEEGDRRIYLDGDEIKFQEYTNGAWSSVNQIVLGGVDTNGVFLPFLGCRGLYNGTPPDSEPMPDNEFYLWDFDSDYLDQNGADWWDTETNVTLVAGKFGNCLTRSSNDYSKVQAEDATGALWTPGEDQTFGFRLKRSSSGTDNTAFFSIKYTAPDSHVTELLLAEDDGTLTLTVYIDSLVEGTVSSAAGEITADTWHFVGVMFDRSANTIYLIVDNNIYSSSVDDEWASVDAGGTCYLTLTCQNDPNYRQYYFDDFAIRTDGIADIDLLIQHYLHEQPWTADYSALDVLLKPATGGVVRVLGDAVVSGGLRWPFLHVADHRPSNTEAGQFTSGDWRQRVINTVLTNEISGASLSSNQITLPPGIYYVDADAAAYGVNAHKMRLRNMTNSTDLVIGLNHMANVADGTTEAARLSGRFTLGATSVLELQHRCANTYVNGFGKAINFGVVEVYVSVSIWKVA